MRRLRRDASICSSGTDRSFPERTPPGFARRSPRDRRYGAARPAKAIERPRVPQSFFSLAPLAKSRRFPRTPLTSAMRAARPPSPQNATKSSEASLTTPAPTAEVGSASAQPKICTPSPLHLVEASRFNLEGREDVEAGKFRLLLRGFGRNAAARDVRGNGGKRKDKAETAEFFFDGHGLFSEEDSTRESREEGPPPFSFLWRSRRPKNTGSGDIRHAGSGDESDRRVSLNVLPDPARCLAGSDYQARN